MSQQQAVPNEAGDKTHLSPLAGLPAPRELLVDLTQLERSYYQRLPDLSDPQQLVSFGTSGHRGSSLKGTFTEAHILAITQAICDYRRARTADRPRSAGCEPGGNGDSAARRRYANAGDFPRDFGSQPRAERTLVGWHRHHAFAQPSTGRRIQVQPAEWRPGGHGHHKMGGDARE